MPPSPRVSDGTNAAEVTSRLEITPVNDAPRLTVPETFTGDEDAAIPIRLSGTPFSDVDSPASRPMTVTLRVADGTIAAATREGVTIGGTPLERTFKGTIAALNGYFTAESPAVTYTPPADAVGSRQLTIKIVEIVGKKRLATAATSQIVIAPRNDAPIVSAPEGFRVTEDVLGNLAWPATATPFRDIDSQSLVVTLAVPKGVIQAASTPSVTVGGTASRRTFSGSPANLNAFFRRTGAIGYTTATDDDTSTPLTVEVSDGIAVTAITRTIAVTPVNDAPVASPTARLVGAVSGRPFEISYEALRAAADVSDAESANPDIVVQAITIGRLQRWNGKAWLPIVGNLSVPISQRRIAPGQRIRWVPPVGATGSVLAFQVRAWDGDKPAAVATQVTIDIAATTP